MNPLDLKILRTMGIRAYGRWPKSPDSLKPTHIARTLGVSPETVKERLGRMEQAGAIRGYQVYPNFLHLGISGSAYLFLVKDDDLKVRAIKEIEPIDGLMEVHNFIGPELCVDLSFASEGELARKLKLLGTHTKCEKAVRFYDRDMPPVSRALSGLDWRILRALRGNARRSLNEVADEISVSAKTVKRRYDRMADEGSFFSVPLLDASKVPGVILFELLFYLEPGASQATTNAILKEFDERQIFTYVPSSPELGNFDVLLFAQTAAETEEMRQRGAAIPGVEKVTALVFRGFFEYSDWLNDAIDARIKSAADVQEPEE